MGFLQGTDNRKRTYRSVLGRAESRRCDNLKDKRHCNHVHNYQMQKQVAGQIEFQCSLQHKFSLMQFIQIPTKSESITTRIAMELIWHTLLGCNYPIHYCFLDLTCAEIQYETLATELYCGYFSFSAILLSNTARCLKKVTSVWAIQPLTEVVPTPEAWEAACLSKRGCGTCWNCRSFTAFILNPESSSIAASDSWKRTQSVSLMSFQ